MKDIFFTILAGWVIYRIWNGIQNVSNIVNGRNSGNQGNRGHSDEQMKEEGRVSVAYVPPEKKGRHNTDDGEYVDYEEIK